MLTTLVAGRLGVRIPTNNSRVLSPPASYIGLACIALRCKNFELYDNLRKISSNYKLYSCTRAMCGQNLLTKNLLMMKKPCWHDGSTPELKPSHHTSQPRAGTHVPTVLILTPGVVLGPDLLGDTDLLYC